MPEYILTYFNGEGLGEAIRLLLHYGKIEFEDRRIDYEKDWTEVKKTFPLGQVPILEVDGKVMFQSLAIARFLAKKVGLYSDDPMEAYEVDNVIDTINDFKAKLSSAQYEEDPIVKEKKWIPIRAETIPFFIAKLEDLATKNDGYLALNKLTWADVYLTGLLTYMKSMIQQDLGDKCPNLKRVVKNVKSLPGIKEWIEIKPKSEW